LPKIAYKHCLQALSRWPKDKLRPECQFQDVMRRRIEKRFLPASSPDSPNGAQAVANSPIDEKLELEQVNAIYSLLENRYSRKVCPVSGF
jgi:cytochrome b pre-mRNA-processing protein 6